MSDNEKYIESVKKKEEDNYIYYKNENKYVVRNKYKIT